MLVQLQTQVLRLTQENVELKTALGEGQQNVITKDGAEDTGGASTVYEPNEEEV